jgi:hypothetical protein
MAKSTKAPSGRGKGPPDPSDLDAFRKWLAKQPREWSATIAVRAALRVLPAIQDSGDKLPAIVLLVFRATAIARFASKYRHSKGVAYAAAVAADAAYAAAVAAAVAADAAYAAAAAVAAVAADAAYAAAAAAAADAAYAAAADAAAYAAGAAYAAAVAVADYGAEGAANVARAAVYAAIKHDTESLHGRALTAEQLARNQLWPTPAPAQFADA